MLVYTFSALISLAFTGFWCYFFTTWKIKYVYRDVMWQTIATFPHKEKGKPVLCASKTRVFQYYEANYMEYNWKGQPESYGELVTHWAYLPDVPKY